MYKGYVAEGPGWLLIGPLFAAMIAGVLSQVAVFCRALQSLQ